MSQTSSKERSYYDTSITIDDLVESKEPYLLVFPDINSENFFKTKKKFDYEKFSNFIIDFYTYFVDVNHFLPNEIEKEINEYGSDKYIRDKEHLIRGSPERLVELFDKIIDYTQTKPLEGLKEFVNTANEQSNLPNSIAQNLLGAINIYNQTNSTNIKRFELRLVENKREKKTKPTLSQRLKSIYNAFLG
jgi:hypothetical protein